MSVLSKRKSDLAVTWLTKSGDIAVSKFFPKKDFKKLKLLIEDNNKRLGSDICTLMCRRVLIDVVTYCTTLKDKTEKNTNNPVLIGDDIPPGSMVTKGFYVNYKESLHYAQRSQSLHSPDAPRGTGKTKDLLDVLGIHDKEINLLSPAAEPAEKAQTRLDTFVNFNASSYKPTM